MFENKKVNLWIIIVVLISLIAVMIIMQAQILMILRDLKASFVEDLSWNIQSQSPEMSQEAMIQTGLLKPLE